MKRKFYCRSFLILVIFIIGWSVGITLSHAQPSCNYTLSPSGYAFSSGGGTGTITVTASSETCTWTGMSISSWITITSGSSGTGSGTITYTVAANTTGSARKGGITVMGQAFTVRQAESVFNDFADRTYWAYHYIYAIYTEGITTGCSQTLLKYCPEDNVTREQMATFIVRTKEGEPPANYCDSGTTFPDVTPDMWSCKYLKRLKELGVTTGYGDGRYGPYDLVTREQMATFIVRSQEGEPPANYCDSGTTFPDVTPDMWSCKYLKRLKELNITTGYQDGTYGPYDLVTRAQMAAFLSRAFLESSALVAVNVTDGNGQFTVNIYGQDVTFQLNDETTGLPIPDLPVGFAANMNGLGVMMAIDSTGNYPARLILFQGEPSTSSAMVAQKTLSSDPTPFIIFLGSQPSSIIPRFTLSTLPNYVNKATDILGLVELGANILNATGLANLGEPTGETLTQDEAMAELRNEWQAGISEKIVLFFATAGLASPLSMEGLMVDLMSFGIKSNTVLNCGIPGYKITVTKLGGMKFLNCVLKTINETTEGLVRAAVSGVDQYGIPLDPTKSSLELISKDSLGDAYVGTFDISGNTTLTVPIGDYKTNVRSPGFKPQILNTVVPQEGVSLNVDMPPGTCDLSRCYNTCFDAYLACYDACPTDPPIPALQCMNACDQVYWACPSYTDPVTCRCSVDP